MARERIELLLDRDSPFLEIAPLCAWGTGRSKRHSRSDLDRYFSNGCRGQSNLP
jgi:acetyl-CoA carboxylase carboxyltransferase component